MKRYGHTKLGIMIFLLLSIIFTHCTSAKTENIVLENGNFRYEMDRAGKNLHFIDKESNTDYLYTDTVSYCASVKQDGKEFKVSSATLNGNLLKLEFSDAGVTAEVKIIKTKDRINFKVASINGKTESMTFVNVPLKLEGMPYEPFAACVLARNLYTHVIQLPALQTHLWATCYKQHGMVGAEITMLGLPQERILPVIRDVMKNAKDIPFSDKGGAFAQQNKEGYGSYLMNFGTLTEQTVDEWIGMVRSVGFNQIDSHGGSEFFKFGDFELNRDKWPDGWESFRRINERLHKAGISSIFHTYTFFIDKDSKYVTPVPSEDLAYSTSFTLAKPVNANDTDIVVNESTANVSTITGFFVRNSVTVRIGKELVVFSGVTDTPPYKFTGCKRGMHGTKASGHAVNEKAFHLKQLWDRFAPGGETALFDEIAKRTAEIVDECKFDGVYFDAIDGSDVPGGPENYWYYGTKFIAAVAKNLKTPVGMEMAGMTHHWWHYRSRWQAWDRGVRGYKRFIDIHLASMKSQTYQHGVFRGHTPEINRLAAAGNGGLLLPLQLGWWSNQTWDPPQVDPTFPDDIEYLGCKMIGNNAGLSMLGGVDKKTLEANPLFVRLIPIIKQYEELRHQNYFNDSICSLLRQSGKEFTLFQQEVGKWNFKPVAYQKHKVTGIDQPSAQWVVNNEFGTQPVKLRIEPLMSVKPFNSSDNITLADFSGTEKFTLEDCADGVSGGITASKEQTGGMNASCSFFASSTGVSPQEGSWIRMEKKFEPWLNLENNKALGVWIKGDGNGELLNLRIESPVHLSHGGRGDHFIEIDFIGWKYFELVEIESSKFSDFIWPDSDLFVYRSYNAKVKYNTVDKLQFWYNNLPAGKDVNCLIGTVKSLPMVSNTIENPSVTIGNETIVFPVKMESGMYIEFKSKNDCKLYGQKGEFLQDVVIEGNVPAFVEGNNQISFKGNGIKGINLRVQVTVISEGKPL
jgi:hypothetical protein